MLLKNMLVKSNCISVVVPYVLFIKYMQCNKIIQNMKTEGSFETPNSGGIAARVQVYSV